MDLFQELSHRSNSDWVSRHQKLSQRSVATNSRDVKAALIILLKISLCLLKSDFYTTLSWFGKRGAGSQHHLQCQPCGCCHFGDWGCQNTKLGKQQLGESGAEKVLCQPEHSCQSQGTEQEARETKAVPCISRVPRTSFSFQGQRMEVTLFRNMSLILGMYSYCSFFFNVYGFIFFWHQSYFSGIAVHTQETRQMDWEINF